ncbi:MAG TPA: hypothetical protein VHR72_05220 [Gemmataceae bacterium]|jgi:hypothetical protein|nr:hypothetical protein [Gemmataceae bacterium]
MTTVGWIRCALIFFFSFVAFTIAGALLPTIVLLAVSATVGLPTSLKDDPFLVAAIVYIGGSVLSVVGMVIGMMFGSGWAYECYRSHLNTAARSVQSDTEPL